MKIVNIESLEEIKNACKEYGFFFVPIRPEDKKIVEELYDYKVKYFAKPMEEKLLQLKKPHMSGYAPLKKTKLKDDTFMLKESFAFKPNEIVCEKNELYVNYHSVISSYAKLIYAKVIESLNLPIDKFSDTQNSCTLTMLHYPPTSEEILGVEPHTDWGFVTLLYTKQPGLQIKYKGEWVMVPVIADHFIVNIGDTIEIMSEGVYKSVIHRVLIAGEKYSIALFLEPSNDYLMTPTDMKYGEYAKHKIASGLK